MNRGPVIRAAALAFVVILIVAMFVGCAKYDGDKAAFCRMLPKAPSFQSLLVRTSTGTTKDASEMMRGAARDFRSLEQSAPRSIRAKVAALGDSAERIGRRLADPSSRDSYVVMHSGDVVGTQIPTQRPDASRRMTMFYNEFSAHPGTATAAYALLTYARQDCGYENIDTTLGLSGYGPVDTYPPYGNMMDGGNGFGPRSSQPGGPGGTVRVIPPAQTLPPPTPSSSVPTTSTTVPR